VIWCLHGFLGRGADWTFLRTASAAAALPDVITPDLFAPRSSLGPKGESLAAWGARFSSYVASDDPAPVLVGYSLGGRLALHALLARPSGWRGAVIVSAHPGLASDGERETRRAEDGRWAQRFEVGPWDGLLADWDARAAFGGRPATLDRPEPAYDRAALAQALRSWSLGTQTSLTGRLGTVTCPVLWIAGADDPRYVEHGTAAVGALPRGELRVAEGAGHRVPWEASEWFAASVAEWMKRVL
jgi:2-succinyl-6-hydroxy-2,4-cyclohexadiene-1-carboxylate synthase